VAGKGSRAPTRTPATTRRRRTASPDPIFGSSVFRRAVAVEGRRAKAVRDAYDRWQEDPEVVEQLEAAELAAVAAFCQAVDQGTDDPTTEYFLLCFRLAVSYCHPALDGHLGREFRLDLEPGFRLDEMTSRVYQRLRQPATRDAVWAAAKAAARAVAVRQRDARVTEWERHPVGRRPMAVRSVVDGWRPSSDKPRGRPPSLLAGYGLNLVSVAELLAHARAGGKRLSTDAAIATVMASAIRDSDSPRSAELLDHWYAFYIREGVSEQRALTRAVKKVVGKSVFDRWKQWVSGAKLGR
jgi:hypothetical protein